MLRAALLALTLAPVALAVDPVDELTMAIRNGSPREALEKTQVWLRSHSANAKDTMTSMPLLSHAVAAGDAGDDALDADEINELRAAQSRGESFFDLMVRATRRKQD